MRDKAAAILDVALIGAGALVVLLVSDWSNRKPVAERRSWRYWTEPLVIGPRRGRT